MIVQRVIQVGIGGDVPGQIETSAEINARVSRGVVDRCDKAEEKVGVWSATDGSHARSRPPAARVIAEEHASRMLGTSEQRRSYAKDSRIAARIGITTWRLLDLRRGVGV